MFLEIGVDMNDMFFNDIEEMIKNRNSVVQAPSGIAQSSGGLLGRIDQLNRQAFSNLQNAPKQPAQQIQIPERMTLDQIPAYLDQNASRMREPFIDQPVSRMQAAPVGEAALPNYIDMQAALKRKMLGY